MEKRKVVRNEEYKNNNKTKKKKERKNQWKINKTNKNEL